MHVPSKSAPPRPGRRGPAWLPTLLLCGLLGASGRAAEAEAPADAAGLASDTLRVDWAEFQQGIARHPRQAEALAATRQAEGLAREAQALPNPGWELRSLRVEPRTGGDPSREDELGLSLPLDWLWTRPGTLRAARAGGVQANAEAHLTELALRLAAGEAFWNLVRDQTLAHSLDEQRRQLQDLRLAVETRVRVGEARPVEATRAEVEALRAELEATSALRSLALSRELFARWLAPGNHSLPWAEAELEALPAPLEPDRHSTTPADHPRLLSARARLEAERGSLSLERMRRLPRLELLASLERAEDRRATGAGLALELPLFNWNRGRVLQAQARLAAAEAGLAAEQRRLLEERAEAQAAWESARAEAHSYRERILPLAEEAARVLDTSWRVGESNLFELIDARRTLAATRRQAIQAYCQAQLDGLRLEILLEKESPR